MVENTFLFIFSNLEEVFTLCFQCLDLEIMFSHLCPFFIKIIMNMSFHGNQIGVMVAILVLKIFH